ncbi:MAG: Hpt domain-containing protein [Oceanidesulfovibrio sp.]
MQENVKDAQLDPVRAEIASLAEGTALLDRFGGDEEIMREVIDKFIEVIAEERAGLVLEKDEDADRTACALRVHSLASSFSPFGLADLSRRCIELESVLLRGDPDVARAGLREIESYLNDFESTMRRMSLP